MSAFPELDSAPQGPRILRFQAHLMKFIHVHTGGTLVIPSLSILGVAICCRFQTCISYINTRFHGDIDFQWEYTRDSKRRPTPSLYHARPFVGVFQSQFLPGLSTFDNNSQQNGSKSGDTAPRPGTGYPHEWPSGASS